MRYMFTIISTSEGAPDFVHMTHNTQAARLAVENRATVVTPKD